MIFIGEDYAVELTGGGSWQPIRFIELVFKISYLVVSMVNKPLLWLTMICQFNQKITSIE